MGIAEGTWRGWLPGERVLCQSLQVGRNTLRAALERLRRQGVIYAVQGSGNRIVVADEPGSRLATKAEAALVREVGLLMPDPLERLRPSQTVWIDELRVMMAERACRLQVVSSRRCFQVNPAAALHRLVLGVARGCWVLVSSHAAMQRWFARHRVPCVVAGSVHQGTALPYCDIDQRAVCRHAVGTLLAKRH